MDINWDGLSSLIVALAALIGSIGGLRWQERRPTDNDQARAYKALRKASARARRHRAAYDDDVREVIRLHAVASAADVPLEHSDLPGAAPAEPSPDEARMASYVERMEKAAAVIDDAVRRGGAQIGRAVATITGPQPAVRPAAGDLEPPPAPRPQPRFARRSDPTQQDPLDTSLAWHTGETGQMPTAPPP